MLFLVSLLAVGIVAGLSLYFWKAAKDLSQLVSIMYDGPVMSSTFAQSAKVNFLKYDASVKKLLLCKDNTKDCDPNSTEYSNHLENMSSDLDVVAERSLSKDNPNIVKEINAKVAEIEAFRKELVKKKSESNLDAFAVVKMWNENTLRKFIEDKIENTTDNEAEIGFDKRQETEAASKAKLRSSMIVLILGIVISIVISFITAAIITSPILELAKACIAFAKGEYSRRSNIVGSPEINFLGESFNQMAEQVEKRDRLIKVEHEKISDLLNNMSQAIFSILPDGTIAGPVSKYSETLFGEVIEGKNIFQVLYRDLPSTSEDLSKVKSALAVVFGEDDLQWSFMEDSFVNRVIRTGVKEQILKVKVTPLWNSQKLLAKIMFVVEDVTEVEALARKIELAKLKNERDIQIIQEFLQTEQQDINKCLKKVGEMLSETLLKAEDVAPKENDLNLIFRHLHTIKGNSRGFKFNILSSCTHSVESDFVKMKNEVVQNASPWTNFSGTFITGLSEVMNVYNNYLTLYQKIFGITGVENQSDGFIAKTRVNQMVARIKVLLAEDKSLLAQYISNELDTLDKVSVVESFMSFKKVVDDLAKHLNKKVNFVCQGDTFYLEDAKMSLFNDAVMHIIRNSLDHGIESPEKRLKLNKPEVGTLEIICTKKDDKKSVILRDDGGGIDPKKIGLIAFQKGLITENELNTMSAEALMMLIFKPGFSSKDVVTDISGRGVGLDVVLENVKKIGGSVRVESKINEGSQFILNFPPV